MSSVITKISPNYRGLARIKRQLEFSLRENDELLSRLVATRAASPADGTDTVQDDGSSPEVCVVVPVYNTAPYLRSCLDALRAQTLSNIEILCVDDGSTDDSLAILNEYAALDPRIRVLQQPHLGVSVARNAALSEARAPFLMSCDSDDWFSPDMCRVMLETLRREDVDVVICGMNVIYDVPEKLRENVVEYLRLKYFGRQEITQELVLVTDVSLCNKIYKRSIVVEHDIDFPVGLLFEDAYFNDAYMTASQTMYFLHLPLYNYLRHDASVMSTSYKKSGTSLDYLQIAFKTWAYLEREGLLDAYAEYYWRRFLQYATFAFKHLTGPEQARAKQLARAFAREHRASLAKASFKTRSSVRILLYGRFKLLHAVYRLPKWLYARLSVSRALRLEITALMEQNMGLEAQIKELLREDD
ncbi:MAG: glycosyltransferase [Coriobacteriales bacterium]|nr:glycosyltransferase [Coriobacteriales bacterium]